MWKAGRLLTGRTAAVRLLASATSSCFAAPAAAPSKSRAFPAALFSSLLNSIASLESWTWKAVRLKKGCEGLL